MQICGTIALGRKESFKFLSRRGKRKSQGKPSLGLAVLHLNPREQSPPADKGHEVFVCMEEMLDSFQAWHKVSKSLTEANKRLCPLLPGLTLSLRPLPGGFQALRVHSADLSDEEVMRKQWSVTKGLKRIDT